MRVTGTSAGNKYPTSGYGFEIAYSDTLNYLSGAGSGVSTFQSYNRDTTAWKDVLFAGNNINFQTNGSSSMVLLSNGNVGIGTTAPGYKLDVTGNIHLTGRLGFGNASPEAMIDFGTNSVTTRPFWLMYNNNAGVNMGIWRDTPAANVSSILVNSDGAFAIGKTTNAATPTFGSEWLRIDNNGNVGIGTTAPTRTLEVVGIIKATSFEGNGAGLTGLTGIDSSKVLKSGDTMTGTLTNTAGAIFGGNVGIGTTSPNASLEVVGNIYISNGSVLAGSASTASTFNPTYNASAIGQWSLTLATWSGAQGQGGSGDIMFSPLGSERMRLLANGNVGIGTSAPTRTLEVNGIVKATSFEGSGAALTGVLSNDITKVLKSGDTMTGTLTNTAGAFFGGSVGVGTMAATAKLSVGRPAGEYGFANPILDFRYGAAELYRNYIDANWNLYFDNTQSPSGVGDIRVKPKANFIVEQGNVGIGTTAPTQTLEVNGIIKANSYLGDGSYLTGIPTVGALTAFVQKIGDTMTGPLDINITSANDNNYLSLTNNQNWTDGKTNNILWKDNVGVVGALGMRYDQVNGTVDFVVNSLYNAGRTGSGTVEFTVKGNGYVGIGTGTPRAPLDLRGDNGPRFLVYGSDSNQGSQSGMGVNLGQLPTSMDIFLGKVSNFSIVTANVLEDYPYPSGYTTRVSMLNNGNVGLGTTAPASKLAVAGSIEITSGSGGSIKFVDGTTQKTSTSTDIKGASFSLPYATAESIIRLPYNITITSVEVYCSDGTNVVGQVSNNGADVVSGTGLTASAGSWSVASGPLSNTAYTAFQNLRFYTPIVNGSVNSATVLIRYTRP
jgi:hypothetical protein